MFEFIMSCMFGIFVMGIVIETVKAINGTTDRQRIDKIEQRLNERDLNEAAYAKCYRDQTERLAAISGTDFDKKATDV